MEQYPVFKSIACAECITNTISRKLASLKAFRGRSPAIILNLRAQDVQFLSCLQIVSAMSTPQKQKYKKDLLRDYDSRFFPDSEGTVTYHS